MITLLQSFVAVLDEFGVSHGRAKKAALAAGEGLIIVGISCYLHTFTPFNYVSKAGPVLKTHSSSRVNDLITAISAYSESTTNAKWLVVPNSKVSNDIVIPDNAHEVRVPLILLPLTYSKTGKNSRYSIAF